MSKTRAQKIEIAISDKYTTGIAFPQFEGAEHHELELECIHIVEDGVDDGKSEISLIIPVDLPKVTIREGDVIMVQMSAALFESIANAIAATRVRFGEAERVSIIPGEDDH
jgi:hypothetical protein